MKRLERRLYAEIALRQGKSLLAQVLKAHAVIEEIPMESRKALGLDFELIAIDEFSEFTPAMINIAQIHAQIGGLKAAIKSLEKRLPFADHGAYGQDRDRIRCMEEEIHRLEDQLKEGHGNV